MQEDSELKYMAEQIHTFSLTPEGKFLNVKDWSSLYLYCLAQFLIYN